MQNSSLRAGEAPLVFHVSTKPPAGDCGTGPLPGTAPSWSRDRQASQIIPSTAFLASSSMRPRPGRRKSLVHPHKPPQPQDSRGFSLTGSAQGWPRAAGIITASISVRYRLVGQNGPPNPGLCTQSRSGWGTEASPARDGLVGFVLRSQLAHKLEVNKSTCVSPRLFRIAVKIRRQSLSC